MLVVFIRAFNDVIQNGGQGFRKSVRIYAQQNDMTKYINGFQSRETFYFASFFLNFLGIPSQKRV